MEYYCRKCKKKVGGFHKCFTPWGGSVRPLKSEPNPNTFLARKLAKYYEECFEEEFPGGIGNARIFRDQLAIRAYKNAGAWIWSLDVINSDHGYPREFGSSYTATDCAKDKYKILITCLSNSGSMSSDEHAFIKGENL